MSRVQLLRQLSDQSRGTILRRVCSPVALPAIRTAPTQHIVRQMMNTLTASDGVGIAAPQVGLPMRMFIAQLDDAYDHEEDEVDTTTAATQAKTTTSTVRSTISRLFTSGTSRPSPSVIINPIIHSSSSRRRDGLEGCLSLPGLVGILPRAVEIDVSYLDEHGQLVRRTFTDFRARLFQHEFDHLNGKLFIDHIDDAKKIWTVSQHARRGERPAGRVERRRSELSSVCPHAQFVVVFSLCRLSSSSPSQDDGWERTRL